MPIPAELPVKRNKRAFYVFNDIGELVASSKELGEMGDGPGYAFRNKELVQNSGWDLSAKGRPEQDAYLRKVSLPELMKSRRETEEALRQTSPLLAAISFPISLVVFPLLFWKKNPFRVHMTLSLNLLSINSQIEQKNAQLARDERERLKTQ